MTSTDEVRAKFGKIWPRHVSSLTRFLIECRRSFDGDIDMFLVMAVIGDRTFSHRKVDPKMDYDMFRAGAFTPPEDINISSIADYSGIPRETVRRKIIQLEEKGWICRNGNGFVTATPEAKVALEPLTDTSIKYVANMLSLLSEE